MSRTYRKRAESFEEYYKFWLAEQDAIHLSGRTLFTSDIWVLAYLKKERYKYKGHTKKYYGWGLPKYFRNSVNRSRRSRDKHEIWKAVNLLDYPEQCSKWNCKDNNDWGYW